jgi:Flp pilus assembly protein TadG
MKRQEGAVAITVALMLLFLLSVAALAVHIGNLMTARAEAQTVADATALAAAECLYAHAISNCNNSGATAPDWLDAGARANNFASSNTILGAAVQVVSSTLGYWDITTTAAKSATTSPDPNNKPPTGNTNILPAVQVVVRKDGSDANGFVPAYLSQIMGVKSLKTSAVATAVVSSPGTADGLFPLAVPQCLYQSYWNSKTNSPDLAQTTTDPQAANKRHPPHHAADRQAVYLRDPIDVPHRHLLRRGVDIVQ